MELILVDWYRSRPLLIRQWAAFIVSAVDTASAGVTTSDATLSTIITNSSTVNTTRLTDLTNHFAPDFIALHISTTARDDELTI